MIQQVRETEAAKMEQLQEQQQILQGYEQRIVMENG
jgi:hypothetical protein